MTSARRFVCTLVCFLAFAASPPNPQLDQDYKSAYELFKAGSYSKAAQSFEEGARQAETAGDSERAMRFWNGAGGSRHAISQYSEALAAYQRAIQAARRIGQDEAAGAISLNVATVYMFLGDLDAAELTLRETRDNIPNSSSWAVLLQLQEGQIQAKRGDLKRAEEITRQAIQAAFFRGFESEALGWEKLGWIYLTANRVAQADLAFTEAYRLSLLRRGEVPPAIYQGLARVRLALRDAQSAERLLDTALDIGTKRANTTPLWYLYQARGRARETSGDYRGALDDFRQAIKLARLWKSSVLPASWMQAASDAGVSSLSADLTGLVQTSAPNRRDLAAEAFIEVEDSKANSLRRLMLAGARVQPERKGEYGEVRARLSDALFRSLQAGGELESPEVRELRARLAVFEAEAASSAGWKDPDSDTPHAVRLRAIQSRLGPQRALFSFQVGEDVSALWVVTSELFQMIRLPGRAELREYADDELKAARENGEASQRRFSALLSRHLPAAVLAKPDWVLSLDGPLFNVPWAALRVPGRDAERYLIEQQSLQVIPSALFLGTPPPVEAAKKHPARLVAVADPIYNRADSRWSGTPAVLSMGLASGNENKPRTIEFARLNATAWEVEAVKRATAGWISETVVLEGADASPEALGKALGKPVSVLHFATHVVASPQRGGTLLLMPEAESLGTDRGSATVQPGEVLIALSMDQAQKIKFLSASEIISANYQLPGSLVVLNGCSSGVGAVLPGAGLLGLSRAWMTAGAKAVVASHWPMMDEDGRFFEMFYRELGYPEKSSSVARALSRTQLAMLKGGGWRSDPRYWAAYFSVGRD